ncbi:MAG: winged helix-turn-helix transcriptional regulator [Nitrososphaerales archaeon]
MAAKLRVKTELENPNLGSGLSCPIIGTIKAVITESRLLVVRHLFDGPKRFNELQRESGLNSKTLSATLRFLEARLIVKREIISTRPFSVQYSLTQSGLELGPALEAIGRWGAKWLPAISHDQIMSVSSH